MEPFDDPEPVVRGSDIVTTCTDSNKLVVTDPTWIEKGMHLANCSSKEFSFDIVKRWHHDHVMDFPVAGIFSPAWVVHPRDVPPLMERHGFRTVELVSSQSVAGDVQGHLALFAERQPELHRWVIDELVKLANDPTIIGSAWHLLYIGRKP